MSVRRIASVASIALGSLMIIAGAVTWWMVSAELDDQNIVIPEDGCLAGREVRGPFTAWCQAAIIEEHALEATGGHTFAEIERDDPLRETAMQASFLRSSLYTSIVAFGVAAMAAAMGVLFVLIGVGMHDVRRHVQEAESGGEGSPV